MSELAEYDAAHAAEWGVYVASEVIYIAGARAFNVGDPVPKSHVANGVVPDESVARRNTKAAGKAAAAATTPPGTES